MKQKYLGVGNENTTQDEWMANVTRDTYNNIQGHSAMLEYVTLASGDNEPKASKRIELLRKMCSNPSKRHIEDETNGS